MGSMKRQKHVELEDESPRLKGVQCATAKDLRAITNLIERMKQLGQSGNDTQL